MNLRDSLNSLKTGMVERTFGGKSYLAPATEEELDLGVEGRRRKRRAELKARISEIDRNSYGIVGGGVMYDSKSKVNSANIERERNTLQKEYDQLDY